MNHKVCIIIPTYKNSATLGRVVESARNYCPDIFIVCDGSDDATLKVAASLSDKAQTVSYSPNRGKGYALKQGFKAAQKAGFDYAITMDADGQHFAEDIPSFLKKIEEGCGEMFIGNRNLAAENMPRKNTFANRFSNFWFALYTWQSVPDTQSGYRAYPLAKVRMPLTNRYEAELEMILRMAWRGVKMVPVPVRVFYATGDEYVSFYRGKDGVRISLLNTVMLLVSIVYGWPSILFHKIFCGGK